MKPNSFEDVGPKAGVLEQGGLKLLEAILDSIGETFTLDELREIFTLGDRGSEKYHRTGVSRIRKSSVYKKEIIDGLTQDGFLAYDGETEQYSVTDKGHEAVNRARDSVPPVDPMFGKIGGSD